jgi:hypothetical protein
MQSVYEVPTPEGLVTITWGDLPPVAEPFIETEGSATVIRVGGIEIILDPEEIEAGESNTVDIARDQRLEQLLRECIDPNEGAYLYMSKDLAARILDELGTIDRIRAVLDGAPPAQA